MKTLDDLLARGLRRARAAHHPVAAQAPAALAHATSRKLKRALKLLADDHLEQAVRLDKAFATLGVPVESEPDAAMRGIIDDGNAVINATERSPELDQELIRSAQLAAHHFLANYGVLRSYAEALGETKAAKSLGKTLSETARSDAALTRLAGQLRPSPGGGGTALAVLAIGLATGGAMVFGARER